ncbi:hypothetical protein [Rhodococcus sp. ZPP]|uniref:hypothetical protein n=1 Tax=Rhodococcus sp. ZPP TaxID=2749906 RepID=UPI001FCCEE61|nr:hypothetical protein [Rhodococcus sp. ZPP]
MKYVLIIVLHVHAGGTDGGGSFRLPPHPGAGRGRFRMETGCTGTVHWRNLTTGATGDAEVRASNSQQSPPPAAAATGSGVLVATITLGIPYSTTFWPGMGMWTVP